MILMYRLLNVFQLPGVERLVQEMSVERPQEGISAISSARSPERRDLHQA
jgi:hypothetical protein